MRNVLDRSSCKAPVSISEKLLIYVETTGLSHWKDSRDRSSMFPVPWQCCDVNSTMFVALLHCCRGRGRVDSGREREDGESGTMSLWLLRTWMVTPAELCNVRSILPSSWPLFYVCFPIGLFVYWSGEFLFHGHCWGWGWNPAVNELNLSHWNH
jgi:hypothetical protein